MLLQVTTFANLRQFSGTKTGELEDIEFREGSTVRQLIAWMGIPETEVMLFIVNGRSVLIDHELQDGDRVSLFPPIAGG